MLRKIKSLRGSSQNWDQEAETRGESWEQNAREIERLLLLKEARDNPKWMVQLLKNLQREGSDLDPVLDKLVNHLGTKAKRQPNRRVHSFNNWSSLRFLRKFSELYD